ncbi:hypothetical protein [Thauera aminoaromatica]|uniref:SLOG cluster 4 domain-containing protein n=1 Tax=Thauera aminoaromatica TaxID=164330 RepID=UPI0023F3E314|nr:hypothetical protein [Thauera aminoaromatica]
MSAHMISVSVVGSGEPVEDAAFADLSKGVGRIVAQHGCNLVTGGGRGVMELVAEGFCKTPYRVGRSIGILPGTMKSEGDQVLDRVTMMSITPKAHYPNAFVEVPVYTHLPGNNPKAPTSRNYLNARTGAVMVALKGGKRTQAEVEIAVALNRPVIALLRARECIGHILSAKSAKGSPCRGNSRRTLGCARKPSAHDGVRQPADPARFRCHPVRLLYGSRERAQLLDALPEHVRDSHE